METEILIVPLYIYFFLGGEIDLCCCLYLIVLVNHLFCVRNIHEDEKMLIGIMSSRWSVII